MGLQCNSAFLFLSFQRRPQNTPPWFFQVFITGPHLARRFGWGGPLGERKLTPVLRGTDAQGPVPDASCFPRPVLGTFSQGEKEGWHGCPHLSAAQRASVARRIADCSAQSAGAGAPGAPGEEETPIAPPGRGSPPGSGRPLPRSLARDDLPPRVTFPQTFLQDRRGRG